MTQELDELTGAAVLFVRSRTWGTFRVLIDPEDWPRVSQYRWQVNAKEIDKGLVYFWTADTKPKAMQLHRLIMGDPDEGFLVDHRDPAATLDNRKQNLRLATHGQSQCNRRKRSSDAIHSEFKGVGKRRRRFRARITHDGKRIELGCCPDTPDGEIACARLYDRAARELYGEFALVNFA